MPEVPKLILINLFPPPRAENTKKTTLLSNYRCLFFKKKWNLPPDPAGGEATATALRRWEGIGECPPPPRQIWWEWRSLQQPAAVGGEAAAVGGALPSTTSVGRGGVGSGLRWREGRQRWRVAPSPPLDPVGGEATVVTGYQPLGGGGDVLPNVAHSSCS